MPACLDKFVKDCYTGLGLLQVHPTVYWANRARVWLAQLPELV